MAFVKFMRLTWPDQATELLRISVQDVQGFRSQLLARNAAPKTLNRRISSLSSFYKYLGAAAAELRLPISDYRINRYNTLEELAVAMWHQIYYYNHTRIHSKLKMQQATFAQAAIINN